MGTGTAEASEPALVGCVGVGRRGREVRCDGEVPAAHTRGKKRAAGGQGGRKEGGGSRQSHKQHGRRAVAAFGRSAERQGPVRCGWEGGDDGGWARGVQNGHRAAAAGWWSGMMCACAQRAADCDTDYPLCVCAEGHTCSAHPPICACVCAHVCTCAPAQPPKIASTAEQSTQRPQPPLTCRTSAVRRSRPRSVRSAPPPPASAPGWPS